MTEHHHPRTARRRVLIITEHPELRDALACGVGLHDHDVVAVENGVNGLLEFLRQPFDLAIVDVELGGMDGTKLLREIRTNDTATPVILMTDARPRRIDTPENTEVLMRPRSPVQLLRVVSAALEHVGFSPALGAPEPQPVKRRGRLLRRHARTRRVTARWSRQRHPARLC